MTLTEEDRLVAETRVGTTLRGKYHLDRVLGVGGMAFVYHATHRNQAEFAVKVLRPELSLRDAVRARFSREGYAANSVKHPGAVRVLDDDVTEDGAPFLVMELLDGWNVEALWKRHGRKLPLAAVVAIGDQLLDVLAAAHANDIVHRDVKPANLFVTREGLLKVLDFGIARVRDAASADAQATASGVMVGTPAYMPPEQALAESGDIDALTDVWAVGATLFTLASGELVHAGGNASQVLVKAATQPARPLAAVAPAVPKEVAQVVDRALSFAKADRWSSARAMREALRAAVEKALGAVPDQASLAGLVPATASEPAAGGDGALTTSRAVSWGAGNPRPTPSALAASNTARVSRQWIPAAIAAGIAAAAMIGAVVAGRLARSTPSPSPPSAASTAAASANAAAPLPSASGPSASASASAVPSAGASPSPSPSLASSSAAGAETAHRVRRPSAPRTPPPSTSPPAAAPPPVTAPLRPSTTSSAMDDRK